MDVPAPPNDIELRNIIDKLAEFVARNGPEFESMTKTKQKGNAKFAFLYGGEYYNYYQYKVATKQQALMKQQGGGGGGMNPFNQNQNQQQSNNNQQMPQIWSNPPPGTQQQQQVVPQQQQQPPQQPAINAQIAAQIEAITTQQNALREQIRQSDINLQAQHGVLLQQQQVQIDEAVTRAQNDALVKQADEHKISLSDFDAILQPIIDSCTKDSISNGKGWILQHCTDSGKCQIISQYLLRNIRKRNDELKKCLEGAVIPMFCNAQITTATDEQRAKLTKLLSLWESKGNFFDACVISKLKSPPSSLQEYQNTLLSQYAAIVTQITQATKGTFDNYQQQHQAFVQHATQQLALLEKQKQQIEQQAIKAAIAAQQQKVAGAGAPLPLLPELAGGGGGGNNANNGISQGNPLLGGGVGGGRGGNIVDRDGSIPSLLDQNINYGMLSGAIQNLQGMNQQQGRDRDNGGGSDNRSGGSYSHSNDSGDGNNNGDYSHPPPNFPIPDMSRPPPYMHQQQQQQSQHGQPQFPNYDDDIDIDRRNEFDDPPMMDDDRDDDDRRHRNDRDHDDDDDRDDDDLRHHQRHHPDDDDLQGQGQMHPDYDDEKPRSPSPQPVQPSIPYFELPAGLMVPLIRLEDFNYHPLEPEQIRLPPPAPPNERLLSAVEAFYAPPSHERPRDGEGWEKLALYEYFKVKNASRKQKEEEIELGTRERSRSPTPIDPDWLKATKKPKKRVYRSRSRSKSREPSPRGRSPPPPRSRRSRSRSRSPRRGRNRSPRSPIRRDRRSITPPSFGGGGFGSGKSGGNPLMEDKVPQQQQQHQQQPQQHMMKMGGGGGMGGMSAGPVGGEVWGGHDREGLGSYGARNSDPYESFRKNKGAAFITRMKTQTDR